ncbi:hypothetical protein SFRURICE_000554 [Spodoptera frugiperda]|nr:hypothetical protein SFRURICE_000554 [Spodoptera frugiperda]
MLGLWGQVLTEVDRSCRAVHVESCVTLLYNITQIALLGGHACDLSTNGVVNYFNLKQRHAFYPISAHYDTGRKCDCLARGFGFDSRVGQGITGYFSVFRKFLSIRTASGIVSTGLIALCNNFISAHWKRGFAMYEEVEKYTEEAPLTLAISQKNYVNMNNPLNLH